MQTKYLKPDQYLQAAQLLQAGELVAFETDTVYGLGALASNQTAVEQVYQVKRRPLTKALIVLVSTEDQWRHLVQPLHAVEEELINQFWPGPLTIVFDANQDMTLDIVRAGQATIAIRQPNNFDIQQLLQAVGEPIVAPSANLSAAPTATNIDEVQHFFDGKIAGILLPQKSTTATGQESTLVRVIDKNNEPKIHLLRKGAITRQSLMTLGYPIVDKS